MGCSSSLPFSFTARRGLGDAPIGWIDAFLLVLLERLDAIRIRAHLRRTESALRDNDTASLRAEQRDRRGQHLDVLRDYWRRGEFPANQAAEERAPKFVGTNGTPCAVAALLLADGKDDLVESIAVRRNGVRIEELDGGPVVDWLRENGFTKAEAARIQPMYVPIPPVGVEFASDCGPLTCRTVRLLASAIALSGFALLEYVGYRLVGGVFPDNPFKRRSVLAYVTALNILLTPLVAVALYALAP